MAFQSARTGMLPPELIEAILDEVTSTHADDDELHDSLRAYSLVAHAFLEPSQRRLFRDVLLGPSAPDSRAQTYDYCAHFLRCLWSQPCLGLYVNTLGVVEKTWGRAARRWFGADARVLLGRVLPRLPHLEHFCLDGDAWWPLSCDAPLRASLGMLSSLSGLKCMALSDVEFQHFGDMADLVCGCRRLEGLRLRRVTFVDLPSAVHQATGRDHLVLDSLVLEEMSEDVVHLLLSSSALNISRLRSLELKEGLTPTSRQELMSTNAPTLHHLSLSVILDPSPTIPAEFTLLAHIPIRSLRLKMCSNWLPALLPCLSPNLQIFELEFDTAPARADSVVWRALDDALTLPGSDFRRLTIHYPDYHRSADEPLREDTFRGWVPRLVETGVLRVVVT
ncbi:hypothetical protein B0H10DRAFT_2053466 [Mycena sp. CBHHK59/15]|nr:hypothetical protein B0H10DRAFT_2053466 [Mycena sp. CBHHK59/15]